MIMIYRTDVDCFSCISSDNERVVEMIQIDVNIKKMHFSLLETAGVTESGQLINLQLKIVES